MRSPPIAPQGFDVDVYVVLDDFGKLGRAYRETDKEAADKETVIRNLIEGQYNDPVRIVAFNTAEGWARDVTEDIATEIRDREDAPAKSSHPVCATSSTARSVEVSGSLPFTHALKISCTLSMGRRSAIQFLLKWPLTAPEPVADQALSAGNILCDVSKSLWPASPAFHRGANSTSATFAASSYASTTLTQITDSTPFGAV